MTNPDPVSEPDEVVLATITETDLYYYAATQYGPPLPNPAGTHTSPPRYDPPRASKQDPR